MSAPGHGPVRDGAVDGLRAGAAALVLLSHARAMLFQDVAQQPGLSTGGQIVFAVSGLGHAAVIVFFVLSGMLVTGAMLRLSDAGRWSLGTFAAARLRRLWIVLVPCLVLGAALDRVGLALIEPGQGYGIPPIGHTPLPPAFGFAVGLGNLLFLQTVTVPVLGSNGPLWSLANEAWYYAVAALAFASWQSRRCPAQAATIAGAAVLILLVLPRAIVALAPVWACGAAVALLRRGFGDPSLAIRRWVTGGGLLLAGATLPAMRLLHGTAGPAVDLAFGLAIAALLAARPLRPRPAAGSVVVRRAAEASYSLYLSHVPVLSLYAALTIGPHRLLFDEKAMVLLGGALLLASLSAAAVWWAFERHTDRLRAWILAPRSRPRPILSPLSEPVS